MKKNSRQKYTRLTAASAFIMTLVLVLVVGGIGLGILGSRKKTATAKQQDQEVLLAAAQHAETDEVDAQEETREEQVSLSSLMISSEPIAEEDRLALQRKVQEEQAKAEEAASAAAALEAEQTPLEPESAYDHIIPDTDRLTISFAGDILFDPGYAILAQMKNRGGALSSSISPKLLNLMNSSDLMVVNNEFPYTATLNPTEGKTYTFHSDPANASYLKDMGVDAAILANNHIYDQGEQGLIHSLETLEQAGIPGIGAGRDLAEASAIHTFRNHQMKVAIIAATDIEQLDNPDTKGATEHSAGVFRCLNDKLLLQRVREAKESGAFTVVFIHWGQENVTEPSWLQLQQAPEIAAAGADLIVGDHPHCLQGLDYINGVPVLYSLGNFLFNSKTVETGILQAEITSDGLQTLRFLPAMQSGCSVKESEGAEKEQILQHLRDLSPRVNLAEDGSITPK